MDEISSFLLSVIESSADAIVGLKPDGQVLSWNAGAERIYGRAAAEMIGNSIALLSLPERADESILILARISNGERVRHFQTTHLKKGGRPFPVSLSISPVVDRSGRIVGASFIARDLSHQLDFERSLREIEQRYQKLRTSLELAQHIQETLLPSLKELSCDLDIFVKTLYSERIGGDYYDFFATKSPPDHVIGIAVGDVAGHGTGAALLMAMAKGVLQVEAEHSPFDLVAIMNRLNQLFCRYTDADRLMTLFLSLIDNHSRLLYWCSAGQGPVYVYHPTDQCFEELPCTGPPLGVLENAGFECKSLMLRGGDLLIIGTDGLWEARNRSGEMFSLERVRQLLATWHHKTAEEICERLLSRVKRFADRDDLEDDTSLMVVKLPARPQLACKPPQATGKRSLSRSGRSGRGPANVYSALSDAMSMEKRDVTSDLTSLS
ncbi:MAG: SpoIIE family protein phosphatase [Desulfuromonadales bacterium]|nr:SpoIIE family protein phosphatase [Desulfuromonadales bacterium]